MNKIIIDCNTIIIGSFAEILNDEIKNIAYITEFFLKYKNLRRKIN